MDSQGDLIQDLPQTNIENDLNDENDVQMIGAIFNSQDDTAKFVDEFKLTFFAIVLFSVFASHFSDHLFIKLGAKTANISLILRAICFAIIFYLLQKKSS